ncbi:hypothetical protein HaLaN_03925 [Haematococcus lacustris]|uniref:Uncharacterized protein n=1 Tax=Haematococcus lacustris TaxID=44745 RepID=A0A699YPM8_HAELA|nr:hypothetical protein HaLaN_03925 [Haematococcus lacustris]
MSRALDLIGTMLRQACTSSTELVLKVMSTAPATVPAAIKSRRTVQLLQVRHSGYLHPGLWCYSELAPTGLRAARRRQTPMAAANVEDGRAETLRREKCMGQNVCHFYRQGCQ